MSRSISTASAARMMTYKAVSNSRSSFIYHARPSTSAFATWPSPLQQRKFRAVSAQQSTPFPSTLSTLPSVLHMVNPKRTGKHGKAAANYSSSSVTTRSAPTQAKKKSQQQSNNLQTKKNKKKEANTGRLRLLPPLQPSTEILSRAQRQTYQEIKDDTKIANQRRRTQKRGAQTIDALCQKLCAPLKQTVTTYQRELKYMHPFEKVVMELTIRARQKKDGLSLSNILEEIHEGRKEILQLSKDWIAKIKNAPTAREAYECTEEAKDVLGQVFLDLIDEPWSGVQELQKSLRNVPIVRLDCPAVVLVGAPNVGKSSIVRAISSGTPEVNNYPFTTRGMTLGHVQVFWESEQEVAAGNVAGVSIPSEKQLVQERLIKRGIKTRRMKEKETLEVYSRKSADNGEVEEEVDETPAAVSLEEQDDTDIYIEPPKSTISNKIFAVSQLCQIMDSPGILRREETEIRNEMEELTLAAMAHLPTAVMYVMDLSGGAGDKCSSVEDQLILRRDLRARFPRRPWIDVISKVDLGIVDGASERLAQILEAEQKQREGDAADQYFIELSVKEGQGVDEVRQEVMRMLGEVRVVLDAMAAHDERIARTV